MCIITCSCIVHTSECIISPQCFLQYYRVELHLLFEQDIFFKISILSYYCSYFIICINIQKNKTHKNVALLYNLMLLVLEEALFYLHFLPVNDTLMSTLFSLCVTCCCVLCCLKCLIALMSVTPIFHTAPHMIEQARGCRSVSVWW